MEKKKMKKTKKTFCGRNDCPQWSICTMALNNNAIDGVIANGNLDKEQYSLIVPQKVPCELFNHE